MCCSLNRRRKPYKLFFNFLYSGRYSLTSFTWCCVGFPVGQVQLVKPKVKAGAENLPSSQTNPAYASPWLSLTNSKAGSCLTLPPLPVPLHSSVPQTAEPRSSLRPLCCCFGTVQPPPPTTLSSLLLPSYLSSLKWLQNPPHVWFLPLTVFSPPPLSPHLYVWFNCVSVPWSSKMGGWRYRRACDVALL